MKGAPNAYQTAQDRSPSETFYEGVAFLMDFKQPHGFEWNTPRENWKPLKRQLARSIPATSSLTSCQPFPSPDATERAQSVERVRRVIEMANWTECPSVRVLGDRFEEKTREDAIGWVVEALGRLGEFAAPRGITVSLELHDSFTDAAPVVVEKVALPNVGFVFNSPFVGCERGSVEPLFSRIAPHITAVHTHHVEKPETSELYRQMFPRLKRMGFGGYTSNECAHRGPDPEKVLALYVALFKVLAA